MTLESEAYLQGHFPMPAAADPRAAGLAGTNGTQRLSSMCRKTKMCRFQVLDLCKRGAACQFAHGVEDLNPLPDLYKTKFCPKLISKGRCGDAHCTFAHKKQELRRPIEGELEQAQMQDDYSMQVQKMMMMMMMGNTGSTEDELAANAVGRRERMVPDFDEDAPFAVDMGTPHAGAFASSDPSSPRSQMSAAPLSMPPPPLALLCPKPFGGKARQPEEGQWAFPSSAGAMMSDPAVVPPPQPFRSLSESSSTQSQRWEDPQAGAAYAGAPYAGLPSLEPVHIPPPSSALLYAKRHNMKPSPYDDANPDSPHGGVAYSGMGDWMDEMLPYVPSDRLSRMSAAEPTSPGLGMGFSDDGYEMPFMRSTASGPRLHAQQIPQGPAMFVGTGHTDAKPPASTPKKSGSRSSVRYLKTKWCTFHLRGRCAKGMKCNFAHEQDEMRLAETPSVDTKPLAMFPIQLQPMNYYTAGYEEEVDEEVADTYSIQNPYTQMAPPLPQASSYEQEDPEEDEAPNTFLSVEAAMNPDTWQKETGLGTISVKNTFLNIQLSKTQHTHAKARSSSMPARLSSADPDNCYDDDEEDDDLTFRPYPTIDFVPQSRQDQDTFRRTTSGMPRRMRI